MARDTNSQYINRKIISLILYYTIYNRLIVFVQLFLLLYYVVLYFIILYDVSSITRLVHYSPLSRDLVDLGI